MILGSCFQSCLLHFVRTLVLTEQEAHHYRVQNVLYKGLTDRLCLTGGFLQTRWCWMWKEQRKILRNCIVTFSSVRQAVVSSNRLSVREPLLYRDDPCLFFKELFFLPSSFLALLIINIGCLLWEGRPTNGRIFNDRCQNKWHKWSRYRLGCYKSPEQMQKVRLNGILLLSCQQLTAIQSHFLRIFVTS